MSWQLLLSSAAAASGSGSGGLSEYTITVSAATVSADLTDYPLMVSLADMPAAFWTDVNSTGGNIRAYASDGVTMLPHDVTYIDKSRSLGRMYIKTNIATATSTTVRIHLTDPADTKLAVTDPNGRNAVWADYEVVWVFPETDNRTGNAYTQDVGGLEPRTDWVSVDYHEFSNNPQQGIACDGTTAVTTITTNELRRYAVGNLVTATATNINPVGDVNTDKGIATLNRVSDGCFISGELWVPVQQWPVSGGVPVEYFAKFNGTSLVYVSAINVSSTSRPHSSICYDGSANIYATDSTDGASIMRYNTSGVLQETITLSTSVSQPQGITYVDGLLYIACNDTNQATYAYQTDGTLIGEVYRRPTIGNQEGLSYDGTDLWTMDFDGDLLRLRKIAQHADSRRIHYSRIFANVPTLSTTWTAATSVYWTVDNGDFQHAFLSYTDGTLDAYRATLAYDEGPDLIALWNNTDSWVYSARNPGANEFFRAAASHTATTRRKVWVDGVATTDSPVAARPGSAGTDADFVINGSKTDFSEVGEGYYQACWLRHEEMSDAWMDADYENQHNPSSFYTAAAA